MNARDQSHPDFTLADQIQKTEDLNAYYEGLAFDLDEKRRIRACHPNLRTELRKFAV